MKDGYVYNYNKLLGKIKEKCGTQEEFAEQLGIGRASLSQRLNNRLQFTQKEMDRAIKLLGMERFDIPAVFFDNVETR